MPASHHVAPGVQCSSDGVPGPVRRRNALLAGKGFDRYITSPSSRLRGLQSCPAAARKYGAPMSIAIANYASKRRLLFPEDAPSQQRLFLQQSGHTHDQPPAALQAAALTATSTASRLAAADWQQPIGSSRLAAADGASQRGRRSKWCKHATRSGCKYDHFNNCIRHHNRTKSHICM